MAFVICGDNNTGYKMGNLVDSHFFCSLLVYLLVSLNLINFKARPTLSINR
jgi:hypothetical protein